MAGNQPPPRGFVPGYGRNMGAGRPLAPLAPSPPGMTPLRPGATPAAPMAQGPVRPL